MDYSSVYIKMCEQAQEIQKLFRPNPSNILWDWAAKYGQTNRDLIEYRESIHQLVFDENDGYEWMAIWLPRQDQLQEMLNEPVDVLLTQFYGFCGSDYSHTGSGFFVETARRFTSMEQLWLAFVMLTLYQKNWSGTDWELLNVE